MTKPLPYVPKTDRTEDTKHALTKYFAIGAGLANIELVNGQGICVWMGDVGVIMDCIIGKGAVFNRREILERFEPAYYSKYRMLVEAARCLWGRYLNKQFWDYKRASRTRCGWLPGVSRKEET